ncbi:mechanosensitive ion channel family protein [Massilia norwichensis]|uniref:Small-conductance mechanosensitive channel n=1 Tax=Massilia norwichensis TaxID=1442366 RepID=A0ABT2A2Y2_9BURK|nr:mechanosensitive ion channel family protein [Massilia norwichensis]MCS0588225.1 mechanosensitive ion channel family protein [Massilia norwichensis]
MFVVTGLDDQDARSRARQIEGRLNAMLDTPGRQRTVKAVPAASPPGAWSVSVSDRTMVVVTLADAQDAGVTVQVLASQWAGLVERALARAAERRRSAGSRFITSIQSSIETAFVRLLESAIVVIPRAVAAALVIAAFWTLASFVRWAMRLVFRKFVSDLTVENLIKQIGYYTVWALGLLVAAGAFGIEPGDVATGLGLTSIALGFALKDILSNFVSGLLILSLRPFQLGDQIIIGTTEGSVERIELRATLIRTYDGRIVSVPNSETFTSRVTNNTANPVRRALVQVHADYDIDLRHCSMVLANAAGSVEGVLPDPSPSVRLVQLEKDELVLELRFWTDSRRSDFVATSSNVRLAVIEQLRKAGIELPSSDLRVALTKPAD